MTRLLLLFLFSIVIVAGSSGSTASAAPPVATTDEARARDYFHVAEYHFSARRYQEALLNYHHAYELKPLPGLLFNIGQCQRLLGLDAEARTSYRTYLERLPLADNRPLVEQLLRDLDVKLAATASTARLQAGASPSDGRGAAGAMAPNASSLPEGPAPPQARKSRAWIYGLVGGLVVVGAGVGIGLGLGLSSPTGGPEAELGTVDVR